MSDRLEAAASGRAQCRACGAKIEKGTLRFGEALPSSYGEGDTNTMYWFHPRCAAHRRPEKFAALLRTGAAAAGGDGGGGSAAGGDSRLAAAGASARDAAADEGAGSTAAVSEAARDAAADEGAGSTAAVSEAARDAAVSEAARGAAVSEAARGAAVSEGARDAAVSEAARDAAVSEGSGDTAVSEPARDAAVSEPAEATPSVSTEAASAGAAAGQPTPMEQLGPEVGARLLAEADVGVAHPNLARLAGVEQASSGRARCRHCRELIAGGAWRFRLSAFEQSGFFEPLGFIHAGCAAAYLGYTDAPVLGERLRQAAPAATVPDDTTLAEILSTPAPSPGESAP